MTRSCQGTVTLDNLHKHIDYFPHAAVFIITKDYFKKTLGLKISYSSYSQSIPFAFFSLPRKDPPPPLSPSDAWTNGTEERAPFPSTLPPLVLPSSTLSAEEMMRVGRQLNFHSHIYKIKNEQPLHKKTLCLCNVYVQEMNRQRTQKYINHPKKKWKAKLTQ